MIRSASESDVCIIASLMYEMVAELESMGELKMVAKPSALAHFKSTVIEEIHNSKCCYRLVDNIAGDVVIGFGFAEIINLSSLWQVDHILEIDALYIEPAHRRKGLGSRIVKSLLEWGQMQGCMHCELNTLINNQAVTFYKSLGFDPLRYKMSLSM